MNIEVRAMCEESFGVDRAAEFIWDAAHLHYPENTLRCGHITHPHSHQYTAYRYMQTISHTCPKVRQERRSARGDDENPYINQRIFRTSNADKKHQVFPLKFYYLAPAQIYFFGRTGGIHAVALQKATELGGCDAGISLCELISLSLSLVLWNGIRILCNM